jgi:hypothetical protein
MKAGKLKSAYGAEMALCTAQAQWRGEASAGMKRVSAGIGMLKISACLGENTGVTASGVAAISASRNGGMKKANRHGK